jgi:hypothetical protein
VIWKGQTAFDNSGRRDGGSNPVRPRSHRKNREEISPHLPVYGTCWNSAHFMAARKSDRPTERTAVEFLESHGRMNYHFLLKSYWVSGPLASYNLLHLKKNIHDGIRLGRGLLELPRGLSRSLFAATLTKLVPWIKNLPMKIGSTAGGRAEQPLLISSSEKQLRVLSKRPKSISHL